MSEGRPAYVGTNNQYFPAMDGLRAVAIVMVFVTHYSTIPYGYLGVSIFFVLSGFLITRVLLNAREQPHRFRTFYLKRSLRIFPPYVLVWGTIALLTPVIHVAWTRANWLYLVYLGNYIWTTWGNQAMIPPGYIHVGFGGLDSRGIARHFLLVGHFWSLCVEEQFYLVWPIVVFWTRQTKRLLTVCFGVIVCVLLLKLPALYLPGFPATVTRTTFFRCDEFAWGGALAILIHLGLAEKLFRQAKRLFLYAGALLVLCLFVDANLAGLAEQRWDFVANTLAIDTLSAAVLLLCMDQNSWVARMLSSAPLVKLGRVSYGFYIFHDILHSMLREWFRGLPVAFGWIVVALAGFAITLAMAVLSYRFVERPFLRMKDRLAPGATA